MWVQLENCNFVTSFNGFDILSIVENKDQMALEDTELYGKHEGAAKIGPPNRESWLSGAGPVAPPFPTESGRRTPSRGVPKVSYRVIPRP